MLRYGNARELCLGLEVVTADGQVWDGLSGLRKDNTGYDLRDLFIGSEGTLGVITAATLKLQPRPAATGTALAATGSLEQCVALLGLAQARLGAGLTGFEVMNRFSLDLVARHFPPCPSRCRRRAWTVLLEQSDNEGEAQARARFESLLEAALEAGHDRRCGGGREPDAVARAVAPARIDPAGAEPGRSEHQARHRAAGVGDTGLRARAPTPRWRRPSPACGWSTSATWATATCTTTCRRPRACRRQQFLDRHEHAVNTLVYDAVCALGGSISAEHGVGALKRDELAQRKSPVALQMMRAIKQALDPHGRLNPGRVL